MSLQQQFADIGDLAGNGGGGDHGRAHEQRAARG